MAQNQRELNEIFTIKMILQFGSLQLRGMEGEGLNTVENRWLIARWTSLQRQKSCNSSEYHCHQQIIWS